MLDTTHLIIMIIGTVLAVGFFIFAIGINVSLRNKILSFLGLKEIKGYLILIKSDEEINAIHNSQKKNEITNNHDTRSQNITQNASWKLIEKVTSSVLHFIVRTFFIQFIGLWALGFTTSLANIVLSIGIIEIGLTTSFSYRLNKAVHDGDKDKSAIIFQILKKIHLLLFGITLVAGIGFSFFLPQLVNDWGSSSGTINQLNSYIIFFLILITNSLTYINNTNNLIVHIDQKTRVITKRTVFVSSAKFAAQFAIIMMFFLDLQTRVIIYYVIELVSTILSTVIAGLYSRKHYQYIYSKNTTKLSEKDSQLVKRDISTNLVNKILSSLSNNLVIYFQTAFVIATMVGILTTYNFIMTTVFSILMMLLNELTTSMAQLYHTSKKSVVIKRYNSICLLTSFLSSCIFVIAFSISTVFVNDVQFLIFGNSDTVGPIFFSDNLFLHYAIFAVIIYSHLDQIFLFPTRLIDNCSGLAIKKVWVNLAAMIFYIIAFFGLKDLFYHYLGDVGCLLLIYLTRLVTSIFRYIVNVHYVHKLIFHTSRFKRYMLDLYNQIPLLISFALMCIVLYLGNTYFPVFRFSGVVYLIVYGLTSLGIVVLTSYLFYHKNEDYSYISGFINNAFRSVFKRKKHKKSV